MKKQRSASDARQFGQSRLPSSFFLPTASVSDEKDHNPRPVPKQPISLSEFLKRKVKTKTIGTPTKEKASTFLPVVTAKQVAGGKGGEASGSVLDKAVFRRFCVHLGKEGGVGSSAPKESGGLPGAESTQEGEGVCTGKRKNPFDGPSGYCYKRSTTRSLLVLGDDPKPKPVRNQNKISEKREKPLYDHCKPFHKSSTAERDGMTPMEVGGGTAAGKELIARKLAATRFGKEWAPPPWEAWNGIDWNPFGISYSPICFPWGHAF